MAGPAAKAVEGKKIPRGKPRAGSNPAPGTNHHIRSNRHTLPLYDINMM